MRREGEAKRAEVWKREEQGRRREEGGRREVQTEHLEEEGKGEGSGRFEEERREVGGQTEPLLEELGRRGMVEVGVQTSQWEWEEIGGGGEVGGGGGEWRRGGWRRGWVEERVG